MMFVVYPFIDETGFSGPLEFWIMEICKLHVFLCPELQFQLKLIVTYVHKVAAISLTSQ